MAVKKVLDEQLVQYLFYGYSVHISILSFQHENCKRMHPSGFQIITWPAIVTSPCLWAVEGDEWGIVPRPCLWAVEGDECGWSQQFC